MILSSGLRGPRIHIFPGTAAPLPCPHANLYVLLPIVISNAVCFHVSLPLLYYINGPSSLVYLCMAWHLHPSSQVHSRWSITVLWIFKKWPSHDYVPRREWSKTGGLYGEDDQLRREANKVANKTAGCLGTWGGTGQGRRRWCEWVNNNTCLSTTKLRIRAAWHLPRKWQIHIEQERKEGKGEQSLQDLASKGICQELSGGRPGVQKEISICNSCWRSQLRNR